MQKKFERHFCLLVLGAFKPFLSVCLVMREDVEHLDRAVKNREGERPRQRTGQDRKHKQVEHSHRLTLNCPAPRGTTNASTKERDLFFWKAQTWEEAKKEIKKERKGCVLCRRQTENSDIHKA